MTADKKPPQQGAAREELKRQSWQRELPRSHLRVRRARSARHAAITP